MVGARSLGGRAVVMPHTAIRNANISSANATLRVGGRGGVSTETTVVANDAGRIILWKAGYASADYGRWRSSQYRTLHNSIDTAGCISIHVNGYLLSEAVIWARFCCRGV